MKKFISKISILMILIVVALGMISPAFASNDDQITNSYVRISYPTVKSVYYRGETVKYKVTVTNPWSYYWCKPFFAVMNLENNNKVEWQEGNYMSAGKTTVWVGSISTSKLPAGNYGFISTAMPIYPGTSTEVGRGNQQTAGNNIKIKNLKAPKSVKVKAGKKKATITFKKATGATKYNIYRSTKKSSGFKCIGSTKTTKYVDKKQRKVKSIIIKLKL